MIRVRFPAYAALPGLAVFTAVTGLVAWTLLPLMLGWLPTVVLTGSMTPAIRPGDVVVIDAVPADGLRIGQVIRFRDPAGPGRHLVHRVARLPEDGTVVTKGDANAAEDSTPVPLQNVEGVARLRVPYIGLPALWIRERALVPLLLVAVTLALASAGSVRSWRRAATAAPVAHIGRHRGPV